MRNVSLIVRKYTRYGLIFIPRILRYAVFKSSRLFTSDSLYLKIVYFLTFGKWIDLEHPENLKLFNEKLQWLKIQECKPIYTQMADKFAVKKIIQEKMGDGYTFPLLGVWNHFCDIDFSKLPENFVIKPTHDSGSIVFCRDKEKFDMCAAEKKLERALSRNYFWYGRENSYKNIIPRLIAEPIMVDESGTQLKDYKLFCFNGKVRFIQVDFDRFENHRRNLYTTDWKFINAFILYPNDPQKEIPRPSCLEKMLEMAEQLSDGIPFVRVDLYVINNRIYFGEFTFFHGTGLERIRPQKFHEQMGEWLQLPIEGKES